MSGDLIPTFAASDASPTPCHSRASGNPGQRLRRLPWTPAFALGDSHKFATTQGRLTESPLPLWERDRVRGFARQRETTSCKSLRDTAFVPRGTYRRLPAPNPSPCPSPTRGEGTLLSRHVSVRRV